MIFFNAHIGRTAGLTLNYILRRNFNNDFFQIDSKIISKYFGKERVFPTTTPLNSYELKYIIDEYGRLPKSISGHVISIPDGLETLKTLDVVKTITFLRNPIDRVISHYFAFRKKRLLEDELPKHVKYDYRHDMKNFFRNYEYIESKFGTYHTIENHQTYFIDNGMDLDKAISRLRNDFWFVGIVERFDEGLLILKDQFEQLGLSFNIMYVRQQIAPRTKQEKEQLVTSEIREKIKKMNKLDQQLYEEANQIFEEKVKNYNGNIKADLQQFRRKLKVWRFYQQIVPGEIKRFSGYFRNINE